MKKCIYPLLPEHGQYSSLFFLNRDGSLNPFNGITTEYNSAPTFADLDGDGDQDAMIGNRTYGLLLYYLNTGSALSPAFTLRSGTSNPFNGLDVEYFSTPSLADLDGDGDLDLFSGELYGTIKYFENTGNTTSPAFIQRIGTWNPFPAFSVGWNSTPSFANLDGDGDLDAFIGEFEGVINYIKNSGNATSPALYPSSLNPFTDVVVGNYSAPTFADLDGDGDLDAFTGEGDGIINYLENTGSATSPAFSLREGSLNPLNGKDVGSSSTPSFVDVDGDGDLDLFSGELNGTIKYFEQITLSENIYLPLALR